MQDGPEISASHQGVSGPSLEPVAVWCGPFGWRPWRACGHHQPRPALYLGRIARDGRFLARVSTHGEGPAAGAAVRAVPARPCAYTRRVRAGVSRGPGGPGLVVVVQELTDAKESNCEGEGIRQSHDGSLDFAEC